MGAVSPEAIERRRALKLEHVKARRTMRREFIASLKWGRICPRCGEGHPACLQFHHRDPDAKESSIQKLVARNRAMPVIAAEVEKCELLCANCHAKEHSEELR